MTREADMIRVWFDELDALAEQANSNLKVMMDRANAGGQPGMVIEGALVAIASQLAYGNAVAAANFYMDHRRALEAS